MKAKIRSYILDNHSRNVFVLNYIRFRTRVVCRRKGKVIEDYVANFISLRSKSKSDRLKVYYDNAVSPETYGDFFCVLMLAKFLALSGQRLEFIILNEKQAERWSDNLTAQQQKKFISDQVKLAKYLLPKGAQVSIIDAHINQKSARKEAASIDLGREPLKDGTAFFDAAPHFLHCLIAKYHWKIPDEFLLKSETGVKHEPFVAWHIRKGQYDERRDSSVKQVQQDFEQLASLFPGHDIKIFSDVAGLEHAFLALTGSPEIRTFWKNGSRVIAQSATCFEEAISEVLNATFYFQRKGGGLGVVPIFSINPYLILCPDVTNFFGKRDNSLVPWARSYQIFHHSWQEIDGMPINKFISQKRETGKPD